MNVDVTEYVQLKNVKTREFTKNEKLFLRDVKKQQTLFSIIFFLLTLILSGLFGYLSYFSHLIGDTSASEYTIFTIGFFIGGLILTISTYNKYQFSRKALLIDGNIEVATKNTYMGPIIRTISLNSFYLNGIKIIPITPALPLEDYVKTAAVLSKGKLILLEIERVYSIDKMIDNGYKLPRWTGFQ